MSCLHVCVCVYHVNAWYGGEQKRVSGHLGTGITGGCGPPCGYWELNPGLLEAQPVLLTVGPSLQSSPSINFVWSSGHSSIRTKVWMSEKTEDPLEISEEKIEDGLRKGC